MPAGLLRKLSEESIRTELCEGPLPDSPTKPATPEQDQDVSHTVSDRAELIERLKRGESPTWVPNRHLESLFHQHTPRSPTRSPRPPSGPSPTLLPAAEITPERERAAAPAEDGEVQERLQEGLTIERPRSALHSGNFTPEESPSESRGDRGTGGQAGVLGHFRTGSQPWLATSPPRDFATPFPSFDRHSYRREVFKSGASSLSSSLSSSFLYKPPTSPLVQSESNDDLDLALPMDNIDIATSSPRHVNGRRHTLHFSQSIPNAQPVFHRQAHYPYQAHQPRRSLTTTPNFSLGTSSPQTPGYLRSRRPSYSSEASPLQHASMVGSYEESILRGRMSTTPSKPLDFMAQIGVLGLGKCKPSLRCPPHVTLPFSAVFYSYSSTAHGRTKSEDGPSPYVGNIDLENGLANPEEEQRAKRKLQTRHPEMRPADDEMTMEDVSIVLSEVESRRTPKRKRRSRSPKAPPGGRYRLPEKGQLQIIIKNQNKTAVKLFLVPYDLSGMEPGTKTFIRQRSYSAGPIVDNVPGVPANTTVDAAADRPILRYLIHLHICCPSKGRFYLYKSIRVVFANRVPDGKEKLRNEVTYPEPRFSPYKPTRSMHPPPLPQGSGGPGAMLAAEQAFRRRSSGFSFANHLPASIRLEDMPMPSPSFGLGFANPGLPFGAPIDALPVDPIPFPILRKQIHSQGSDGSDVTMAPPQSSGSSDRTSRPPTQDSNSMSGLQWTTPDAERYDKLSKGDIGYGGNAFAPTANGTGGAGATEGLLSKRLRSLGVQGREGIRGGGGEMPKEEEHPSAA
ncbi:hypothetical protein GQ53DRAFT_773959 [Thozetella sp. PMI_491]|nr:hypothetical protein GQ53DRAFT_773959 [Thozetella sp. PMI_491]